MSTTEPPLKRRFTIVEVAVVTAIVALLAGIAVPVFLNRGEDPTLTGDTSRVQEAVGRYRDDTGVYPTFSPSPGPGQTPSNPWTAGGIPGPDSVPAFAGIDFDATANKPGQDEPVRFSPDYLEKKPRHAGEASADGTRRWRIDSGGNVSINLDGRSY